MTISIVYSIMTTIRVGGAKSCPEGFLFRTQCQQFQLQSQDPKQSRSNAIQVEFIVDAGPIAPIYFEFY